MDELRPRLLLFLSVDVIGSTAYKNSPGTGGQVQPWLQFFQDFYEEFPVLFQKKRVESQTGFTESHDWPVSLSIWKTLGDEMLFYTELREFRQAEWLVVAFHNAITEMNQLRAKTYQSHGGHKQVRFKGTAWTAGFPVTNAEVLLSGTDHRDFLGPNIDIGFRLTNYADAHKLVISCELAILLSSRTNFPLRFHFDGTHRLKGVIDDRPYPIIWIGNREELEFKNLPRWDNGDVQTFCREFIEKTGYPLMIPFIDNDREFSARPPNYEQLLESVRSMQDPAGVEEPPLPAVDQQ